MNFLKKTIKYFLFSILLGSLIAIPCTKLLTSTLGDSQEMGGRTSDFLFHKLQNLEEIKYSNNEYRILLTRNGYDLTEKEKLNSVSLSFDENHALSLQKNLIESASYNPKHYYDGSGLSAAFELINHKILLRLPKYSFLSHSNSTGNFSIHLNARFSQLQHDMEIFRKIGIFEGKRQGLKAIWKNNQVFFEFYNFFWNQESPLEFISLKTRDSISAEKFYSLLLVYKENDGSLTLYLNGKEQSKLYLTTTFTSKGNILTPKFHRWDKSSLVIGENFFGALDDIIFSNEILSYQEDAGTYGKVTRNGSRFAQRKGIYISKRLSLKYSAGDIFNIQTDADIPSNTRLDFYARSSDIPFKEDTSEKELPFKKINLSDNLLKGKYFQWKAEFFSDPLGEKTPVLKKVKWLKKENPPPSAPKNLKVVRSGKDFVVLSFSRNNEIDVISGGHYHVYYGIEPYQPLGLLRFEKKDANGKPIFFSEKNHLQNNDAYSFNSIEITISNQAIQENLVYARNKPFFQFEYPLLQKNIPMYFWITATDNAWSENPQHVDHESSPSLTIIARTK